MLKRYTLGPMAKLWAREETKFEHWLDVEIAVLRARVAMGELPRAAYDAIHAVAENHVMDVERIDELDRLFRHDMIAFVTAFQEAAEANGAGEHKGKFHQMVGSYDIEDPAMILMLRQATREIIGAFRILEAAIRGKAVVHKWTWMIARTHGQWAQPTTFGCLLMVFREEMRRNIGRLEWIVENELGEGKLSGEVGCYTGVSPATEESALAYLGLKPAAAETQILQRDRHAMLLGAFAIAAATIEQMCRTFWEMMRSEVHELEEPRSKKQRGSSGMPHKRNPILTEQLQGLARLIRGYAHTAVENIATPECRDISQSSVERHIFPDACALLYYMAMKAAELVGGLVIFEKKMIFWLVEGSGGVWASQRVKDALIDAGVDPSAAYDYTQSACFMAQRTGRHLRDVLRELPECDGSLRTLADLIGRERLESFFDVQALTERGVTHIFRNESEG